MPVVQWQAARSWPATEATIINSKIIEHDSGDGTSYSVEFTYRYVVNGQEYENNKYSFLEINGSRKRAQKLKNKHPSGSTTNCFYDPADPGKSVLDNSMGWKLLFGLFPLVFVLVGGIVFWGAVFKGWGKRGVAKREVERESNFTSTPAGNLRQQATMATEGNADALLDQEFDGPLKLKPAHSKWVILSIALVFSLIWNGIVSVFVYNVISDGFEIFATLFMIPFVLVGLGSIGFCLYTFLSTFNPKIEIALSNGAVPLGHEVDVAWEVEGNVSCIRKLSIHIQGEESATYRRGTDTHTDTNTFEKIEITSTNLTDDIQFGTATVTIPEHSMHSLKAGNNAINWSVEVRGDIPWWPDVKEKMEFRVRP